MKIRKNFIQILLLISLTFANISYAEDSLPLPEEEINAGTQKEELLEEKETTKPARVTRKPVQTQAVKTSNSENTEKSAELNEDESAEEDLTKEIDTSGTEDSINNKFLSQLSFSDSTMYLIVGIVLTIIIIAASIFFIRKKKKNQLPLVSNDVSNSENKITMPETSIPIIDNLAEKMDSFSKQEAKMQEYNKEPLTVEIDPKSSLTESKIQMADDIPENINMPQSNEEAGINPEIKEPEPALPTNISTSENQAGIENDTIKITPIADEPESPKI